MSMKLLKYRGYKNKLATLIRVAKKNYYNDKLDESKSDLKQTWKILNEVLNRRIAKTQYPANFTNNGVKIS